MDNKQVYVYFVEDMDEPSDLHLWKFENLADAEEFIKVKTEESDTGHFNFLVYCAKPTPYLYGCCELTPTIYYNCDSSNYFL